MNHVTNSGARRVAPVHEKRHRRTHSRSSLWVGDRSGRIPTAARLLSRLCLARREGPREQTTEPGTPVTGQLSVTTYCAMTARLLSTQVVRFLVHLVCRTYDAGVGFVGALADNHIDELFDDTHVRVFQKALPQTPSPSCPPGSPTMASPEASVG